MIITSYKYKSQVICGIFWGVYTYNFLLVFFNSFIFERTHLKLAFLAYIYTYIFIYLYIYICIYIHIVFVKPITIH